MIPTLAMLRRGARCKIPLHHPIPNRALLPHFQARSSLLRHFSTTRKGDPMEQPPQRKNDLSAPSRLTKYVDAETGGSYGSLPYHLRPASKTKTCGKHILNDSLYNKGGAFTLGERDRFRLRGLLPSRKATMQEQLERIMVQLNQEVSPIRKNRYLRELLDTNETLFHRVLLDNIKQLAPIVYTPTVGDACIEFGEAFRRPRGMYFNYHDQGDMAAMMYNWDCDDVQIIVVTDGSRILGLGDLGAHGMGIPIGKLQLYVAAGGICPKAVLPVMFDAGTDNEELLKDEFYTGLRHFRLTGDDYYEMLDEFVQAVFHRFPNALLQFEDFSTDKAADILKRYRDDFCVFNDDIQGTGAISVAGLMAALRVQGKDPASALKDQKILVAGAGSAGIGVASFLHDAMVKQGIDSEAAYKQFWVCDVNGILSVDNPSLTTEQRKFARSDSTAGLSLLECARTVQPNALLGLTACHDLFTEELIREMASFNDRPIIFPLSNPIKNCECTFENAIRWTSGRAIFASGSPFDEVSYEGKVFKMGQVNNVFVFPGLGFGAVAAHARVVSEGMIYAASLAVADSVLDEDIANGMVVPDLGRIREVSFNVAMAVVKQSIVEGIARNDSVLECKSDAELKTYSVAKCMSQFTHLWFTVNDKYTRSSLSYHSNKYIL